MQGTWKDLPEGSDTERRDLKQEKKIQIRIRRVFQVETTAY